MIKNTKVKKDINVAENKQGSEVKNWTGNIYFGYPFSWT